MGVLGLLNQTIMYALRTGLDEFLKPTYQTPVSLKARVQDTNEVLTLDTGEEVVAVHIVYIEPTIAISELGRITLEDSSTPPILGVKAERGLLGTISHYKVWLGAKNLRRV